MSLLFLRSSVKIIRQALSETKRVENVAAANIQ